MGPEAGLFTKYKDLTAWKTYEPVLTHVLKKIDQLEDFPKNKIIGEANWLKKNLAQDPSRVNELLPDAFAVFTKIAESIFGFRLNETQLFASILLWNGKIVELKTGEGKTMVGALVAYLQSLTGEGVHVITTNDYLAERDWRWTQIIFNELGIDTGLVIQKTPRMNRRVEYGKAITYVANQEAAFDYLRDNLVMDPGEKVHRGFALAIIDEIDSLLIDEARTPFVISKNIPAEKDEDFKTCLAVAKALVPQVDFDIDYKHKSINFTDPGVTKIISLFGRDIFAADEQVLSRYLWYGVYALTFLEKGQDYIMKDGKVILVDEFTGHEMPDRRLMEGLQQILEMIEGLELKEESSIVAAVTYRNFFRLYGKICGMSGTVIPAEDEFHDLYDLEVIEISPPHKIVRVDYPSVFFRLRSEKLAYVVKEIREKREMKTPVLAVARSVAAAEIFSQLLIDSGIPHQLLTAAVTESEFEIIKNAGKEGMVTVATNMAGRGADIIIKTSRKDGSALVVIGLEHNLSRRIDDQLRGRSGRQGAMGATRFFASLEDEIFQNFGSKKFWNYAERISWKPEGLQKPKLAKLLAEAQFEAERIAAQVRETSTEFEDVINNKQKFIYALRNAFLESENVTLEVFSEMKRVLGNEPHAMDPVLAKHEKELLKTAKQWFSGLNRGGLTKGKNRDIKVKILSTLDDMWRECLEEMWWVRDSISLRGVANENPLIEFVFEVDKIIHDMLTDFFSQSMASVDNSLLLNK